MNEFISIEQEHPKVSKMNNSTKKSKIVVGLIDGIKPIAAIYEEFNDDIESGSHWYSINTLDVIDGVTHWCDIPELPANKE